MEPADLGAFAVDPWLVVKRTPDDRASLVTSYRLCAVENHLRSICSGLGALVALGDTVDDAAVVVERRANHQAILRDVVQTQLLAMVVPPHLDYRHHLANLALHLDVALDYEVVAQERDQVSTESQVGKGL